MQQVENLEVCVIIVHNIALIIFAVVQIST